MKVRIFGRVRNIPDLAVVILVDLLVVALFHYLVVSPAKETPYYSSLFLLEILLLSLIPFGWLYARYRRIKEKEKYFPQFLKDLADVHRTGMSLVQAAYHASQQHYGPLTDDVKKLAVRLSWGVPFEKAFTLFAKESGSPLIQSAVLIILEAFQSGGKIADVLETVASDVRRLREIQEDRKSRFAPFIGTVYTVFILSLLLAHILLNVLLPEIPVLPSFSVSFAGFGGGGGGGTTSVPEYPMKVIFLHLLLIQAVVSGLLAGIVGEGSWTAGLKHVIILGFIALVFFHLIILPVDPVDRIGRTIGKIPTTFNMTVDLGEYYVEKNITVDKVAEFIKNYRRTFGTASVPSIDFQRDVKCQPCDEGKVIVKKDGVYVKEPVYLSFRVVSNGNGTVTVFVGG